MKKIPLLLFLLAASLASATGTVAVLEITPADELDLKISEYRHLTDELRTRAREALPDGYVVLTRDNIISLMPSDAEEAQCLAESCAVEIGRAIGAEYVTQGFVGEFGGMLTLTVELYESMSGNLLGSFVTESKEVMSLLTTIREKAPGLFAKISKPAPSQPVKEQPKELDVASEIAKQPQKIDPQVESIEKKTNTSFWVAVALDVVGAGLLCYGYMQERAATDKFDSYMSLNASSSRSQFGDSWQKVEDASTIRNVSYVAGGIFLAAGIGVHVWF
ncbi:MAG: hypothetical protein FWC26_06140 [Fibromonadales bacterium]|nr:hypothetical protein [Fibromonadales bacterium]